MIIAITSGKGGSGKTTLTGLASTGIFSRTDKKVSVVDIDPQNSFYKKRSREIKEAKEAGVNTTLYRTMKKNIERKNKAVSDVYKFNLYGDFQEIKEKLNALDKKNDIVFIDFPGSLELHMNTLKILTLVDHIFIPLYIDENSFDSTLVFIMGIQKLIKQKKIKAKYNIFFNKYNDSVNGKNSSEFKRVKKQLLETKFPLMENHVYDNASYERYHTIIPPRYSLHKKNISLWIEELEQLALKEN